MGKFIDSFSLEHRTNEAIKMRTRYPNSICTIVEKADKSNIIKLDKKKFLIPKDLTVGQFIYILRKRIKLSPEQAIFIFVNSHLPASGSTISEIYEKYRNDDGFLYLTYSGENVFG